MPPALKPECEERRLVALESYRLLNQDVELAFDRYTRLAAMIIGAPIAAISFVDADRQFFKSVFGTTLHETPRDHAFCAHAILGMQPMIVCDAVLDPRFSDNPLVVSDPHIRFYAGAPLRTPDGMNIGTLCAVDSHPREVTEAQTRALADLADGVVMTLELYKTMAEMKRLALTDPLTGLANRAQFFHSLAATVSASTRERKPFSLMYLDCDNFKRLNDTQGHDAGDRLLQALALLLKTSLRGEDLPARLGGDEFAVILPGLSAHNGSLAAHRLLEAAHAMMRMLDSPTSLSIGLVTFFMPPANADVALALADQAMYDAKSSGKSRVHAVIAGNRTLLRLIEPNPASIAL